MNDFTHWLDAIRYQSGTRRIDFFSAIFAKLEELGFELENPDAIEDGYRLSFKKGDKWVIADRYSSFPVAGETPGVYLYDETESWEASFTAYSPIYLVLKSLEYLAEDENE